MRCCPFSSANGRAARRRASRTSRIRREPDTRAPLAGRRHLDSAHEAVASAALAAPGIDRRRLADLACAAPRRSRRPTSCTCTATGCCRKSGAGSRTASGQPVVLTLYGTEIWHYRPKRSARSVHARLPTRPAPSRSTASGCSSARGSSASIGRDCHVIYPPVAAAFTLSRRGRATRRCGGRSA